MYTKVYFMIITVGHKTINNSSFLKYILNNHFKNIKLRDISFTNHNKNKKLKKLKVRLLIQYIYIYKAKCSIYTWNNQNNIICAKINDFN